MTLALVLLAMTALPAIRSNSRLVWSFCGASGGLLLWLAILARQVLRGKRALGLEFVPIQSHYIQATLHFSIYSYWGYYWRKVYGEAPLILAQIVFLYALDMILCWSRRDRWRLGFGSIPIVFSTNLFLWFKDDWFYFQFLMIATGALGKEFIRWRRDGKLTHIFNPSGFSLSVFSIGLILTGTTDHTWGHEVATTMNQAPHMFLWIFCVGLVVQYFFSVTLMTLSAAAVLCVLNLIYTQLTGVYFFIDSNIPIAVFLGLHLLMTDPSTSPRTQVGRVIFGGCYGLAVYVLYWLFDLAGVPEFYDKLLCVPVLNLTVQSIDRIARGPWLVRWDQLGGGLGARRLNFIHMGVWIALFATMLSTGFVGNSHPGARVEFWRKAVAEGRRKAGEKLVRMLDYQIASGSSEAPNELGILLIEGKIVPSNPEAATLLFTKASSMGNLEASCNLANLYINYQHGRPEDVAQALDQLEATPQLDTHGRNSFFAGLAYATGRGKPLDKQRALSLYRRSCDAGWRDGCIQVAKMRLTGDGVPIDNTEAAAALERSSAAGDALSAFHLAGLLYQGRGVPRDEVRARQLLQKACSEGLPEACNQLKALAK